MWERASRMKACDVLSGLAAAAAMRSQRSSSSRMVGVGMLMDPSRWQRLNVPHGRRLFGLAAYTPYGPSLAASCFVLA